MRAGACPLSLLVRGGARPRGRVWRSVIPGAGAVSPINPNNRPTPLPGAVNGLVPMSRLVHVAPNCITVRGRPEPGAHLRDGARDQRRARRRPVLPAALRRGEVRERGESTRQQPGVRRDRRHGRERQTPSATRTTVGARRPTSPTPVSHLTFASRGYAFMKQVAGSLGWNHPAFAEPGGSSCPEPWHWEWVGDGGNLGASTVRGDAIALLPSADDRGYATVDGLGGLRSRRQLREPRVGRVEAHRVGDGGGSRDARPARLLDGRSRRRRVQLRQRGTSTDRPARSGSCNRSTRSRRRSRARVTGSWPGTAACSASAMRTSSARPVAMHLNFPVDGIGADAEWPRLLARRE